MFSILVLIEEELSEEEVVTETNEVNDSSESEHSSGSDNEMEADNEDDQQDENDDNDDGDEGNVGWANTFAKVLQQEKPKNKKYLVLSRAKKLTEKKVDIDDGKKALTFEIDGKNGDDDEVDSNGELKPSKEDIELAILAQKDRNNKLNELRVKPSAMDRDRERAFKRIATKGVVQLFNAVRSQQKDLVDKLEKAGPLDHKRDAVLNNINKRQFLDVLMGGKRAKSENIDNPVKEEIFKDEPDADDGTAKPSQWSVLRDDFMTNKKIASHWDKDDDDDDGDGNGVGGGDTGSDGDSD